MVSNVEIFNELYERIVSGASKKEILQDFGGANLYIPSYKSIQRDEDIREEYRSLLNKKNSKKQIMLTLQQKYNLSEQHLYKILKDERQPSLF